MFLFHVTHKTNMASILRRGLQLGYNRGRIRGVWLCPKVSPHLLAHLARQHGWKVADLRVVKVDVGQLALRKHYLRGFDFADNMAFLHMADVPAALVSRCQLTTAA